MDNLFNSEDLDSLVRGMSLRGLDSSYIYNKIKELKDSFNISLKEETIQYLSGIKDEHSSLTHKVEAWISDQKGVFTLKGISSDLALTSPGDKANVRKIVSRLVGKKIEHHGKRSGEYRRIEGEIIPVDYTTVDTTKPMEFVLPFGIEKRTMILPRGCLVLAGFTGWGKTVLSLNIVLENMHKLPVFYFNSEPGPENINYKLRQFNHPLKDWAKHMTVIDEWSFMNIADKIQPDALNVVDYLQAPGDQAWDVHRVIDSMTRKLDKGLLLVCIQKSPGQLYGEGGKYSAKVASLYLSLEYGKLTIAKNRYQESDKIGKSFDTINFDILPGQIIKAKGGWYDGGWNGKKKTTRYDDFVPEED